ncbi:hypothetical protein H1D32_19485 [Anaerobacillus sp. CMMVII]|uniref:YqfQ family protein n=1 Tax=Anaerobacillus sp. CMMVII TaxID=2755588 RepID=UPI0021B80ACA|nr:YqfQ family protein [Anaerobacillus sp. CMMVII]MCT8139701.1 hypothetical protein [Anaerobacillus sp. CMMVII]
MYPMPTPQMPPYAPGPSMLARGFFQGGAHQLSHVPLQQGMVGQSGGLLSKLFGGAQAGGGGLNNILGMIQNAQKAIGVVQQVSPMVQQYAPFVKSLPALISMMRNSNSEDSADESEATEEKPVKLTGGKKKAIANEKKQQGKPKTKKKHTNRNKKPKPLNINKTPVRKAPKEITKGVPAPKLYI